MPLATKAKLFRDAKSYLSSNYVDRLPKEPSALARYLTQNAWTPVGDAAKVGLVTIAYALVLVYGDNEALLVALRKIENKKTDRRRKAPDAARTFIEAIDLDPLADGPKDQARRRSAWSIAVRHLVGRQIPPTAVEALARQPGEGLDAWSRAQRAANRAKAPRLPTAPRLPGKIRLTIGDGEARKWSIKATRSELRDLIRLLNRLAG